MKIYQRESRANFNRGKKKSANSKIDQLRLSSLSNGKKEKETEAQRPVKHHQVYEHICNEFQEEKKEKGEKNI